MEKKSIKKYNILLWKNKIWESKVSNTGDLAIILNTIFKTKQEIPNAQFHMFSDDPEYVQKRYGVTAYPIKQILNPFKLYQIIKKIDLVILGGGTVIQDNYFIGVIPINIAIPLIAKFFGKKIVCNAIGIAAENEISLFGKRLSIFALKRFDSITVRDRESKEFLNKWLKGIPSVILTNDMALDLPKIDSNIINKILSKEGINITEKPTIAIAARKIFHHEKTILHFLPSSLRTKLGLMHPLYKKRIKEFKTSLANFCDHITKKYNVNILFIPFYSSGGSINTEDIRTPSRIFSSGDNKFIEEVIGYIENKDNVRVLHRDYEPEETVAIISKCEGLIGIPYHSIVFASSCNVPVIGINYVSKIQRYMKRLGLEEYSIPAKIHEGVSIELLKEMFDKLWDNRKDIRNRLKIRNEELESLSYLNISILKDLLNYEQDF